MLSPYYYYPGVMASSTAYHARCCLECLVGAEGHPILQLAEARR